MPKTNPNVRKFYFTKSSEEVVADLNRNLPINISALESLVDRVSKRYPVINKSEVSMIVRGLFNTMREMLVMGKHFSLYGLMEEMKLRFYWLDRYGVRIPALKVRLTSSPNLKETDNDE